jgi:hypothetical protein
MKIHLVIGLCAGFLSAAMGGSAWAAEDSITDYGVSPAILCPTITHAPSASEAALLIACSTSYDNFNHAAVYRTFNVRIQVGKPRAYAIGDPGGNEIDPSSPVYPIRGQRTLSLCSPISDYMKNAGKNCSESDFQGDGICYLTPYADWKCALGGILVASRYNVPPPQ